jgi:hypothetical protein
MAAPNIVNVSTITGKLAVQAVGTSATAIVTNSAASGQVYKINILTISNIDIGNIGLITVDVFRSGTAYRISSNISVPIGSSFTPIDKSTIYYLEEGDTLRLTANATSRFEATCSYEVIS